MLDLTSSGQEAHASVMDILQQVQCVLDTDYAVMLVLRRPLLQFRVHAKEGATMFRAAKIAPILSIPSEMVTSKIASHMAVPTASSFCGMAFVVERDLLEMDNAKAEDEIRNILDSMDAALRALDDLEGMLS